ncbi:MAG: GrpB family protein [Chlamydiota bacterium]
MNMPHIEIVPYDPAWPLQYEIEKGPIERALGINCLAIHHFGSTSIPGLFAKPKIDILAVVKDLSTIDNNSLEKLGFTARGEVIPTGRYFSKDHPKVHLHIFKQGNPLIKRNLLFRDWLKNHPQDREAYAIVKKKLSLIHNDGMEYCHAKTQFVETILEKASKEN